MAEDASIDSILKEGGTFPPSPEFSKQANIKTQEEYERMYKESIENPEKFWGELAKEMHWFKPWEKVLQWEPPFAKWFVGGKTNISYNCLDKNIDQGKGDKVAYIWVGEPGEVKKFTYSQLKTEVCKFSNVLKNNGVKTGDRVCLYMPMIPELPIAMLACARIGAPHSIVFGGFSADALRDRINDAEAKVVITADGGFRRGKPAALKPTVDEAVKNAKSVEKVIVVKRTKEEITMTPRDVLWEDEMAKASDDFPAVPLDSEHPLFILYTSGTTGKPKGIVHTTGGYMLGAYTTSKWVFDLKDSDVYWCTADIGWITGHTYIVYGILQNGVTSVMYEGVPNYPKEDRFWDIIEKYKVTIFYTAPTAIRTFIKWGDEHPNSHDLSSLRLLGTVGEPINPAAWEWYHRVIGNKKCPIVDTWWQTETGTIMITSLPGVTATKPGSASFPLFGVVPEVVTRDGKEVPLGSGGYLILKKPWPSMLRTLYKDPERYRKQYWSDYPGMYFTGDGARRDKDGYFWVMGRVDDVINVSGHRLSTMEVESALTSHAAVAEAAVVGRPDEVKGQALCAFVTLEKGQTGGDDLIKALKNHVAKEIGPIAKPDDIRFSDTLPKTRSGKIMRRLLREIAQGSHTMGDTTTLEDVSVVQSLMNKDDEE